MLIFSIVVSTRHTHTSEAGVKPKWKGLSDAGGTAEMRPSEVGPHRFLKCQGFHFRFDRGRDNCSRSHLLDHVLAGQIQIIIAMWIARRAAARVT